MSILSLMRPMRPLRLALVALYHSNYWNELNLCCMYVVWPVTTIHIQRPFALWWQNARDSFRRGILLKFHEHENFVARHKKKMSNEHSWARQSNGIQWRKLFAFCVLFFHWREKKKLKDLRSQCFCSIFHIYYYPRPSLAHSIFSFLLSQASKKNSNS